MILKRWLSYPNHIRCSPEILVSIKRNQANAFTADLECTDLHQLVSRKWSHHRAGPKVGVIITWHRFQRAVWVLWWLPWLQWIKRYHCVRKGRSGRYLLQEQLLALYLTLCVTDGVWLQLMRRFKPPSRTAERITSLCLFPLGSINTPHPRGSVSVNKRCLEACCWSAE